jgi:hypothetical protein
MQSLASVQIQKRPDNERTKIPMAENVDKKYK